MLSPRGPWGTVAMSGGVQVFAESGAAAGSCAAPRVLVFPRNARPRANATGKDQGAAYCDGSNHVSAPSREGSFVLI